MAGAGCTYTIGWLWGFNEIVHVKCQVGERLPKGILPSLGLCFTSTSIQHRLFQSSPTVSFLQEKQTKIAPWSKQKKECEVMEAGGTKPKSSRLSLPFPFFFPPQYACISRCTDFPDPIRPQIPFLSGILWCNKLQRETSSPRMRIHFGSFPANVTLLLLLPSPKLAHPGGPSRRKIREVHIYLHFPQPPLWSGLPREQNVESDYSKSHLLIGNWSPFMTELGHYWRTELQWKNLISRTSQFNWILKIILMYSQGILFGINKCACVTDSCLHSLPCWPRARVKSSRRPDFVSEKCGFRQVHKMEHLLALW